MRKDVRLESNVEIREFNEYSDDKLAIAKVCVLSTAPNSHQLNISEEVLRRDIGTIRGNFLVADMVLGDATTHTSSEVPVGYFMQNEPIEFEEFEKDGNTYLRAWAYAVLSKQYAKSAYEMFINDNHRATSIEMKIEVDEEDENKVVSFDAYGSTILGKSVAPSCKEAEISLVRFAEDANTFFNQHKNSLTSLQEFVKKRKESMDGQEKLVSHPVDTSKEVIYDGEWDGQKAKQDLVKEKNFKTLAPKVCMKLESGWEDREVTKLGYPVMMLHDGKWVYAVKGLASALGYAKKENETEVINKIEKIYKKLGLDSDRKEEDAEMAEIAFAAVDIGDMWGKLWDALHAKYPDGDWGSVYRIDGIYEEDNKKFAIIRHKDEDAKYRLDFSLTEEGLTLSDEIVKVELEIIETDEVKKFAEPEGAEKYMQFEIEGRKAWAKIIKKVQDHEGNGAYVDSIEDDYIIYTKDNVRYRVEADVDVDDDDKTVDADIKWDTVKKDKEQKMSVEDLMKEIENRDNIIMEKDKELEELRKFKKDIEDKELASNVNNLMSNLKEYLNEEDYDKFYKEGMECKMAEIDGWSNRVKAFCFENSKNSKNSNILSFAMPINNIKKESDNVWDRLKNKLN